MTLIPLRNGPVVSADAIAMALALDDQGYTLRAVEGLLRLTPWPDARPLTETQKDAIRGLKPHLLAIAAYLGDPTLWDVNTPR